MSTEVQRRVRRIKRQRFWRAYDRAVDARTALVLQVSGMPDVRAEIAAILAPLNDLYRPARPPLRLTRRGVA